MKNICLPIMLVIGIILLGCGANWLKRENTKNQRLDKLYTDFQDIVDNAHEVMSGEIIASEDDPFSRYNITHYAGYEKAAKINANIKIESVEEVQEYKKYIIRVLYTQELINDSGEILAGSWNVNACWIVEKNGDNEWIVSRIQELT